ncbi:GlsB/YeaQ/YmgE family stress response membrane protein [Thermoflavifilum thermophilum]|uniref:Transglycosylase associated protein n=1 Tax=Thermoflavifilum thermophilum TaxID=1393122 RepID=A0A1I7NG45_9BACT|nr:GlsB/YeaQ/YmgE family stress response membrane protein [Thermoflavifilum thermophilum]SFV33647.1 Transglycosylase associated protein [Thermoflavifilum thermophilum]
MSIGSFLVLLLIAAICGAIGQSLAGYNLGGCLVSLVVGLIGAYMGTWLAAQLHLPLMLAVRIQGELFPVIWAIIGSAIFTFIVALLRNMVRRT